MIKEPAEPPSEISLLSSAADLSVLGPTAMPER
jgi:hypothetical protein